MARIITLARLNRARRTANDDLSVCGLYTDDLDAVPVRLTSVGWAYGYCWDTGEIEIPAASASRLGEIIGRPRLPLTDVVRHELAHAPAAMHPDVVDGWPSLRARVRREP